MNKTVDIISAVDNKPDSRYTAVLMTGLTPPEESKVKSEAGDKIRYESVDDITVPLKQEEVANIVSADYRWKDHDTSHYWLRHQGLFPQIATSIDKTRELQNSLKKYFHCSGCVDKQTATAGVFCIEKRELKSHAVPINLHVYFIENRRCCIHHMNVSYGQTRGLSAALLREKDISPRQLRAERLETIPIQQRLTGNRQDVPTPQAARKLKQMGNNRNNYTIGERFHSSIRLINEKEELKYAEANGEEAEKKRRLRGYIQKPVMVDPISIHLYNEASLSYYHYYAASNPGVFLDYTGLMVKDVYGFLREKPIAANDKPHPVLNAILTLPSGNSKKEADAPPVLTAEFIVTDLSAKHLSFCLHSFRQKEYEIFGSNTVPYLVQSDCAWGILRAVLLEYNGETPNEYLERLMENIVSGNEPDCRKVLVSWCYGHCIRAVRGHVRSANFRCQPKIDKKNILNAAMRIWSRVQFRTNFTEADKETKCWNWLLNQQYLNLVNYSIDINALESLLTKRLDLESDNLPTNELRIDASDVFDDRLVDENPATDNKVSREWHYTVNGEIILQIMETLTDITDSNGDDCINKGGLIMTINDRHYVTGYVLVIPDLHIKIPILISPDINGRFLNPLYSPELARYLSRQWWSSIVLWSNLVKRIAERERRTTATIEVHHKILKTMDIAKRNLPLDQYLYERAAVIRANQQLVAEKMMFVGSKKALQQQQNLKNNDNESWAKNIVKLSPTEEQLLTNFIQAYKIRERCSNLTQRVCARELCDLSGNKIGIKQGSISRMLQKKYIPRDKLTLDVIRKWVSEINNSVALQEGLVSESDQIDVLENESKMSEQKEKEECEDNLAFKK